MCMLCGALGIEQHWAEKDRDAPGRKRERRVRIRLLNRVLRHYGMDVKLWGRAYMLNRRGGTSQRADNLGALWLGVEQASGRRCDPLDPAFLSELSGEDPSPS